jgi:hypothetical protein
MTPIGWIVRSVSIGPIHDATPYPEPNPTIENIYCEDKGEAIILITPAFSPTGDGQRPGQGWPVAPAMPFPV